MINVPPGTSKSTLCAVVFPAWVWLHDPTWRSIWASGTPSVVTRDSLKTRQLIESAWYRETFKPEWSLSKEQNEKQLFKNTAGGFRMAMGAGQAVVGERADFLGVDDPNDPREVHSKAHRDSINDRWWAQSFHNRIASPKRSRRLIIMQRLHEDDLCGFLLAREAEEWEHLCLPMTFRAEEKRKKTWLGWGDKREENELLHPERFDEDYLKKEKTALGSAGYAGQMDQNPYPATGNRFQKAWWRFWSPAGGKAALTRPKGCNTADSVMRPRKFEDEWQSWDMTFKGTDGTDYVVGLVLASVGADVYVLHRERARMTFTETVKAVLRVTQLFPSARRKLVEDKANGSAVIDMLKSKIQGLVPVEPEGGKESRAASIEPAVEAGNVLLPDGATWLDEWVTEFAAFPKGKHDDQVDALSQGMPQGTSDAQRARMLLGLVRISG